MSTTKESSETQIELLTEENFPTWLVDIRAKLRSKKLWKYTQSPYKNENKTEDTTIEGESSTTTVKSTPVTKKEQKEIQEWEDGTQDAADFMTPMISRTVKKKLTEAEFNNGYLMLSRLHTLLQPSEEYQYLVQIWAVTPNITAEKARQMVLEASRQHSQALHNSQDPARAFKAEREKCDHCGSTGHLSYKCWTVHPELAPEWFRQLMKEQAKGKGKNAEQAKKFQAKLATMAREDDFVDNDSTHITA